MNHCTFTILSRVRGTMCQILRDLRRIPSSVHRAFGERLPRQSRRLCDVWLRLRRAGPSATSAVHPILPGSQSDSPSQIPAAPKTNLPVARCSLLVGAPGIVECDSSAIFSWCSQAIASMLYKRSQPPPCNCNTLSHLVSQGQQVYTSNDGNEID